MNTFLFTTPSLTKGYDSKFPRETFTASCNVLMIGIRKICEPHNVYNIHGIFNARMMNSKRHHLEDLVLKKDHTWITFFFVNYFTFSHVVHLSSKLKSLQTDSVLVLAGAHIFTQFSTKSL